MDSTELRLELKQHTGSEQVFRHSLVKSFNYTEGMRSFFQNAGGGAYWLSDILATEPKIRNGVRQHGFCVCVLSVVGTVGILTVARDYSEDAEEGSKFDTVIYTRKINYTDCPEGDWKFYLTDTVVGGSEVVLAMLPREY